MYTWKKRACLTLIAQQSIFVINTFILNSVKRSHHFVFRNSSSWRTLQAFLWMLSVFLCCSLSRSSYTASLMLKNKALLRHFLDVLFVFLIYSVNTDKNLNQTFFFHIWIHYSLVDSLTNKSHHRRCHCHRNNRNTWVWDQESMQRKSPVEKKVGSQKSGKPRGG